MKAIRGGPTNRGPFKGPVFDNNGTGEVTRAPLYVTSGWKRWATPDIFPNVVVAVVLATLPAPAPVEPTYFKRPTTQIDVSPNIAARFQTAVPAGAYIDPIRWKPRLPDPDVLPNIAARFQTARPAGAYVEPDRWQTRPPVPDVLPNIAVKLQTAQPAGSYVEPQRWATRSPVPDVLPNVAALVPAPSAPVPAAIEPQISKRLPPQIDVTPSFAQTEIVPVERAPLYVTTKWVQWTPAEQVPNLAVRFQTATPAGAYIDPPRWATRPPVPDVLPNLAVNLQTQRPAGSYVDPVRWKPAPLPPDLPPNLATLIPPPKVVIPAPIDPQLTRRLWPPIDVLPNVAANVGTEAVPIVRAPFYATVPWRPWAPFELGPNLAARGVPAVYVPPAPLDPQFARRLPSVPDVFQNRAVYAPPEAVFVTAIDAVMVSGGRFAQPDLPTNKALYSAAETILLPVPVEPLLWKPRLNLDLYPNLAVERQTIVLAGSYIDPTRWATRPPVPDVSPNVAAFAPAPVPPLILLLDPWINRCYSPQLEVFQNKAIYAPASAPIMLQALIEPVRWKPIFQFELVPNLAVFQPPIAFLRVRAVISGTCQNQFRFQGDVFDIVATDLSDSTVNYAPGSASGPLYGWMQVVAPTTTLVEAGRAYFSTLMNTLPRTV